MKKLSLLPLILCLPALAQDGFRVGVELGSMKTTTDYSNYVWNETASYPNYAYTVSGDTQPTQKPFSLELAWVKGENEYALTFMTTNKAVNQDLVDSSNYLYQTHQVFKAQVVDLTWKRAFAKWEGGSLAFSAGLRSISGSDDYTQIQSGGGFYYYYSNKTSGSGLGLTTGLHGKLDFSDRFWLSTGLTLAMVNSKVSVDREYYDYNHSQTGTDTYPGDRSKSILQTDAYLRLNLRVVGGLQGYLGYGVRNFGSEAFGNYYQFGTQGFGLAGTTLGLSYTF